LDQNLDENKAKLHWLDNRVLLIGSSILLVLLLILVMFVALQGTYTDKPGLQTPPPTVVAGQAMLTSAALDTQTANGGTPATFSPDACAGYYGLYFGGFQPQGTVLLTLAISPVTSDSHIIEFNLNWRHYSLNGADIYLTEVGVSNANESPEGPSYVPIWHNPARTDSGPTTDSEGSTSWNNAKVPVLKRNTLVNIWLSFTNAHNQLFSDGASMDDFQNSTLTLSNGCVITLNSVAVPTSTYWVTPIPETPTATPTDMPTDTSGDTATQSAS